MSAGRGRVDSGRSNDQALNMGALNAGAEADGEGSGEEGQPPGSGTWPKVPGELDLPGIVRLVLWRREQPPHPPEPAPITPYESNAEWSDAFNASAGLDSLGAWCRGCIASQIARESVVARVTRRALAAEAPVWRAVAFDRPPWGSRYFEHGAPPRGFNRYWVLSSRTGLDCDGAIAGLDVFARWVRSPPTSQETKPEQPRRQRTTNRAGMWTARARCSAGATQREGRPRVAWALGLVPHWPRRMGRRRRRLELGPFPRWTSDD
jgi:hypothetical protein